MLSPFAENVCFCVLLIVVVRSLYSDWLTVKGLRIIVRLDRGAHHRDGHLLFRDSDTGILWAPLLEEGSYTRGKKAGQIDPDRRPDRPVSNCSGLTDRER